MQVSKFPELCSCAMWCPEVSSVHWPQPPGAHRAGGMWLQHCYLWLCFSKRGACLLHALSFPSTAVCLSSQTGKWRNPGCQVSSPQVLLQLVILEHSCHLTGPEQEFCGAGCAVVEHMLMNHTHTAKHRLRKAILEKEQNTKPKSWEPLGLRTPHCGTYDKNGF